MFFPNTSSSKIAFTKSNIARARVRSMVDSKISYTLKSLNCNKSSDHSFTIPFTIKMIETKASETEHKKYMAMLKLEKIPKNRLGELIFIASRK